MANQILKNPIHPIMKTKTNYILHFWFICEQSNALPLHKSKNHLFIISLSSSHSPILFFFFFCRFWCYGFVSLMGFRVWRLSILCCDGFGGGMDFALAGHLRWRHFRVVRCFSSENFRLRDLGGCNVGFVRAFDFRWCIIAVWFGVMIVWFLVMLCCVGDGGE
jgi:hypothetical protein